MAKRFSAVVFVIAIATCLSTVLPAQQPPNYNVNSSIPDPTHPEGAQYVADPYRQRTVEPTVAVSPLNSDVLMAASNNYSVVDMFADPTVGTGEGSQLARLLNWFVKAKAPLAAAKEAWIGVYFSYDRGRHWVNMLHPGHPGDESPQGMALPIFGRTAASDPVLAAAPGSAHFYLGGMYFDRGGFSQVAVSRYTHVNDDSKHSIFQDYDRFRVVDQGAAVSLNFADKGYIAADIPRGGKPFGKVFFTYSVFTGTGDGNQFQSQVRLTVSEDGGGTWSKPKKVNGTLIRNQGSFPVFSPNTGMGYIFWRTFNPNRIMWVMASDGKTVSNPAVVANICAYDAPTQSPPAADLARTLAFPTAAFDNNNRVHVVWQGRALVNNACTNQGMPRIFMTTGTVNPTTGNITSWTTPRMIDTAPRWEMVIQGEGPTEVAPGTQGAQQRPAGPQFKPSIAYSGGFLLVTYKETRLDNNPNTPDLDVNGFPSGISRRVDARAARIDVRSMPFIGTTRQIATYDIDSLTGNIIQSNPNSAPGTREAVHFESLRMYQHGSAAFGGDYEFVVPATSFVTGSSWRWATNQDVPSPSFFSVWYDTRTVKFPGGSISGDWTQFTNPGLNQPGCNPGSRNSSIYFAEIDAGVVVSSPQTFKEMGATNGQVTYAATIRNRTLQPRQFELRLVTASGVDASWDQFNATVDIMGRGPGLDPVTGKCPAGSYPTCTERLAILPRSSATLTVFATGPDPSPMNAITVIVDDKTPGIPQLADTVLRLNPQDQADVPDATTDETHTPGIGTPGIGTPGIGTPGIGTVAPNGAPGIGTPGIGTPGIGTPGIGTAAPGDWGSYTQVVFPVSNEELQNADINTTSGFNTFINLANEEDITSEHLLQLIIVEPGTNPTTDGCNAGEVIYDQLISNIPGTPGIGTPGIGTPGIGTPGIGTATVSNATFSLAPSSSVGGSHQPDGALHSLRGPDRKLVVVRAWHCRNPQGCDVGGGRVLDFEAPNEPESFPDTPAEVESGVVLTVVGANPKSGGIVLNTPTIVTSKAPDLFISSGTPAVSPASVAAGGTVQFPVGGWTLQNAPTPAATAKAPFSHGYYLSTDAVIDPSTDTLLGTEVTSVDLAPGGSQSFAQRTLTIPLGTAPGDYFIGISIDRSNAVAESNEANNSAAVALEVTVPAGRPIPGGEIIVSDSTSLHRFSPTGTFNGTIATLPNGGCPRGTVVGPGGDFFVADPCTDTIHKVTATGVVSTVYQADQQNPEEPLKAPIAIAMDVNGNLIVGDNNVDKLFKLAPDGSSIVEFAALPGPSPTILQDIDIKRDAFGNLVVAYDSFGGGGVATSGAVIRLSPDGTPTAVISGTGAFSVGGLAIKPDGNYVIGDFANDRIVQVTPRGSITVLIASGALDSNLVGMAIDSGGSFISTLNFSNKLLKITLPDTVATLAEGPPIAGPRYVVLYPGVAGLSTITFQDQAVGPYEGGTVTLSAGGVDVTFSGAGLTIRDLTSSGFPAGASRVLSTEPSDLEPITATLTFPAGVTANFVQIRNWIHGVHTNEVDHIVMSAYDASNVLLGTVESSTEFISLAFPGIARVVFDDVAGDWGDGYVIDEFQFIVEGETPLALHDQPRHRNTPRGGPTGVAESGEPLVVLRVKD